jgi:hypothetical protein
VLLFIYGRKYGWRELTLSIQILLIMITLSSIFYAFVRIRKTESLRLRRRLGVIINYLFLYILLVCFYLIQFFRLFEKRFILGIDIIIIATGALAVIVIIVSFIEVHLRTGLWHLTHTNRDNLDERQTEIAHEAVRYAYSIFTILCLTFFLVTELIRDYYSGPFNLPLIPVIAAFIYLAHTLPSSILAWREKEV